MKRPASPKARGGRPQKADVPGSSPGLGTNPQVDAYDATVVDYGGILTRIQMTPDEIDYVVAAIRAAPDDALIVEWGTGGSTCRWYEAMRPGQRLIAVEHCPEWHDKLVLAATTAFSERLQGPESPGFELVLAREHPDVERRPYSEPYIDAAERRVRDIDFHKEEAPCFVPHYIDPRADVWDADVFLVDGICRGAVLATILAKRRRRAPVILLHDYRDREIVYDWAVNLFPHHELVTGYLCRLYV